MGIICLHICSDGIQVSSIPIQFSSGSGCASIAIRYGVITGFGVTLLGQGFSFKAGLFANIPSYQVYVTNDPTTACEFEFTESITGDVGAYADIDAKIDVVAVKAGPSVVVHLFSASLPETCLASKTRLPTIVPTISCPIPTSQPPYTQTTAYPPSPDCSRIAGTFKTITRTTTTLYTITECGTCLE